MSQSRHRLIYASSDFASIARCLARDIQAELRAPGSLRFPSTGEYGVHTRESVDGAEVTVLADLTPGAHDQLFEHLLLLRALREGGATRVTSVVPYLPYCRSDRQYHPYGPVAVDLVRDLIAEAGADVLVTVDLHARELQDHRSLVHRDVSAAPLAIDVVGQWHEPGTVLVAVDAGAHRRINDLAAALDCPVIGCQKRRLGDDSVLLRPPGTANLHDRRAVIVDDALYTGASIEAAATALRAAGVGGIDVFVTHLLPTAEAAVHIRNAGIERIASTDSTSSSMHGRLGRSVQVASLAPLLAEHLGAT